MNPTPERIGTIEQLWRYPVKSMAGERLAAAAFTRRGIPGDRGWAVWDETRAGVTNGKRQPRLRTCVARYAVEPVAGEASPPALVTLPDGGETRVEREGPDARLSALLGGPMAFRALGPDGAEAAGRLLLSAEPVEAQRAMMGLLPGEPDADLSALTPELLARLRQGNFFDAFPVHLLTRATLRTLAAAAPESDWDLHRFRMNLLVETDATGYPELAWVGRRVRVGSAVLEVAMGCPRCVMVTQATESLPADPRVMRTLVRETHHTAGVYAHVVEGGHARAGDPVELL